MPARILLFCTVFKGVKSHGRQQRDQENRAPSQTISPRPEGVIDEAILTTASLPVVAVVKPPASPAVR